MNRCHLAPVAGDGANDVLAAAGYDDRRLLTWLAHRLALLAHSLRVHEKTSASLMTPCFTDDE